MTDRQSPPRARRLRPMVLVFAAAVALLAAASCRVTDTGDYLWLYNNSIFYPGDEKITVGLETTKARTVDMAVYRLDLLKLAGKKDVNLHNLSGIDFAGAKPVAAWTQEQDYNAGYYNHTYVDIPVKEEGAYLVAARARGKIATTLLVITHLALVTKADPDTLVVYAADRKTGVPEADVRILTFPSLTGDLVTDKNGLARRDGIVRPESGGNVVIVGEKDGSVALCDGYFNSADYARYKGYTYTDRPIYRPGQVVHMKGILRHYTGSGYENLPAEDVKVEVTGPSSEPVFKAELKTSAFGSYVSEFALGEEPPLGRYTITTKFRDQSFASFFDVEEYRKPEYQVTVTAAEDFYFPGDVLSFTVDGRYYFGAPVAKAAVNYTVQRRQNYVRWWYGYEYSWFYGDDDPYYYGWGWEYVTAGSGNLDDDGRFRGNLALPSDLNANYQYRVVATMTDASRKQVMGEATVSVWRAAFDLTCRCDKYFYWAGDDVRMTFEAKDPAGKPYAADVSLELYTERWEPAADDRYGKWVEEKVASATVEVGADGTGAWVYKKPKAGYYFARATARDERGRVVECMPSFYVADEDYYRSYYSGGGVTITLDKDTYAPGETAHVLIQSCYEGAAILFTIEGEELYHAEVVRPQGNTATLDIPVEAGFAPNVYLCAAVVAGNGYTTALNTNLIVPPEDRFLKVEIKSDKAVYKPRDKASFTVTAADAAGRPVAAELSLGVADESVYALKADDTPDIRKFFYDRRPLTVATNTSFYFYSYGSGYREMEGRGGGFEEIAADAVMLEAPAKGKESRGKKDGDDFVAPVIRAYFPDTAFWGPQLETDAAGRAQVEFDIPDSLTTWRATARAVTADTKVGEARSTVIATKNLLIRLETPRVLTQWDEVYLGGVVHNYLPSDERVRVELAAGPEVKVKGAPARELVIPAGGEARVEWPCFVEGVGAVKVTAKALTGIESDAMELTVPILPHGLEYAAASSRVETAGFTDIVEVPADAAAGATTLDISLAPSLAGTMLDALDYLAGYPYGCVEQTMSRFLPDVYVAHTMQALGLKNETLAAELPKMTKAGLERLYSFQHHDGGWGWWTDDNTHPFMTAYVCYGLLKAREADCDVRDEVLKRGLASLREQLDDRKAHEGSTYLYMLYVLAEAGEAAADQPLLRAYSNRGKYDSYELALLALALAKRGKAAEADAVINELEAKAIEESAFVHFAGVGEWHYSWSDSPIQTTATVLRAILAVRGSEDPHLEGMVRWLLLNRRGNYWRSTQETAAVVFALSDYLAATRELEGDYTARVYVNGRFVDQMKVTPANISGARLHLTLGDKAGGLQPGRNEIRVEMEGTGRMYYSTLLTYFKQADELAPVANGFAVTREYYKLDKDGSAHKAGIPDVVKPGDRFRVQVTFKTEHDMEYVMLEDFLPSGFEVDEDELKTKYYYDWYYGNFHQERRDEKMVFFFTSLPAGERTCTYVIHAEQPGKHLALPARASLMYAPEFWGSSAEAAFDVALE